jgi:hypothetical protein
MTIETLAVDVSTTPGAPGVAVDDVSGKKFEISKAAYGPEGAATLVDVDHPMPTHDAAAATEVTLAALKGVADSIATAAAAIQSAVASINTKTTAIDTGAIAGTVALDAPTLAALETINSNTGLAQPLTDTQLRAAAVPVSAAALPLPAGAATQATLAALNADLGDQADAQATDDTSAFSLIALVKRLLGKIPGIGQKTMAGSQSVVIASDQAAIPVTGSFTATADLGVALLRAMEMFNEGPHIDPASGRLRVLIDALGGAQTLGTVTTVGTVTTLTTCATLTSLSQIAGVPANSFIFDSIDVAWAQCIRGRIS